MAHPFLTLSVQQRRMVSTGRGRQPPSPRKMVVGGHHDQPDPQNAQFFQMQRCDWGLRSRTSLLHECKVCFNLSIVLDTDNKTHSDRLALCIYAVHTVTVYTSREITELKKICNAERSFLVCFQISPHHEFPLTKQLQSHA